MTASHDEGGPAFPTNGTSHRLPEGGMMLRDWFAGQALVGTLAAPNTKGEPEDFAKAAYIYADAMLDARKAKP